MLQQIRTGQSRDSVTGLSGDTAQRTLNDLSPLLFEGALDHSSAAHKGLIDELFQNSRFFIVKFWPVSDDSFPVWLIQ